MAYPTQLQMETNMASGKGDLGVKRIAPPQDIPKMSKAPTRTGDAKKHFDVSKKMKKVMNHVATKGC